MPPVVEVSSSDESEGDCEVVDVTTERMDDWQAICERHNCANMAQAMAPVARRTLQRCLQAAESLEGDGQIVPPEALEAVCRENTGETLKDYQRRGIAFVHQRYASKEIGGAILADEMGLGKTAQSICWLAYAYGVMRDGDGFWNQPSADNDGGGGDDDGEAAAPRPPPSSEKQPSAKRRRVVVSLVSDDEEGEDEEDEKEEDEDEEGDDDEEYDFTFPTVVPTTVPQSGQWQSRIWEWRPVLVVLPVSVMENWNRELSYWWPSSRTAVYHGSPREKDDVRREAMRFIKTLDKYKRIRVPAEGTGNVVVPDELMPPFDVLLTTYGMFERDDAQARSDRSFLRKIPWHISVFDEAHNVKNFNSKRVQKLGYVLNGDEDGSQSGVRFRLLLTGTPFQNNFLELHSILSFTCPGTFPASWAAEVAGVVDEDGDYGGIDGGGGCDDDDDDDDDDVKARSADMAAAATTSAPEEPTAREQYYRLCFRPFMLRRLKEGVLQQLVKKTRRTVRVDMTSMQEELYKRLKRDAKRAIKSADTDASEAAKSSDVSTIIRNYFVVLRKAASHPFLVRNRYTDALLTEVAHVVYAHGIYDASSVARVEDELTSKSDHQIHQVMESVLGIEDGAVPTGTMTKRRERYGHLLLQPESDVLAGSAKVKYLFDELLPDLASQGRKVLIFSQWTQVLDMLEWAFRVARDRISAGTTTAVGKGERGEASAAVDFVKETPLTELKCNRRRPSSPSARTPRGKAKTPVRSAASNRARHLEFCRLDGSTKQADRQGLVDEFNDPNSSLFAFLLSTRAGGQGLNLTGASAVVLFDLDVNPQIDRQAEDRAHRLGQERDVDVIRLVTKGTVEESIERIAEEKLRIDASLLGQLQQKDLTAHQMIDLMEE